MRDGGLLRLVKTAVRWVWILELGIRRGWPGAAARVPWRLAGECRRCARCCEKPTVHVGAVSWRLPFVRRLLVAWHSRINGFALVEADAETHTLAFRCGHFDWTTRACDSYASRPFMCRDYPRALLDQAWPELFEGCGYRPVARNAASLQAALVDAGVPEETRRELARKLRLE